MVRADSKTNSVVSANVQIFGTNHQQKKTVDELLTTCNDAHPNNVHSAAEAYKNILHSRNEGLYLQTGTIDTQIITAINSTRPQWFNVPTRRV